MKKLADISQFESLMNSCVCFGNGGAQNGFLVSLNDAQDMRDIPYDYLDSHLYDTFVQLNPHADINDAAGYSDQENRVNRYLNYLTSVADLGSGNAQYELGTHYLDGIMTNRDLRKAEEWFTKAAKQGHTKAQ